jgi:CubicO group peptidase (beta-lactamase class C family)
VRIIHQIRSIDQNIIDTVWVYSSGTTNMIQKMLRYTCFGDNVTAYWEFPRKYIFDPIGMKSMVMEIDPSGNFVGSSFSYATARDYARFGLLFLQDGIWDGQQILPKGWVEYSTTPTPSAPQVHIQLPNQAIIIHFRDALELIGG